MKFLKIIRKPFINIFNGFVFFCKKYYLELFLTTTILYAILLFFTISGGFGGTGTPFPNHYLDTIEIAVRNSHNNNMTNQFRNCFISSGEYDLYTINFDVLINICNRVNNNPQFTSLIRNEERESINRFLNFNYELNRQASYDYRNNIYMLTSLYVCFTIFVFLSKFETTSMLLI